MARRAAFTLARTPERCVDSSALFLFRYLRLVI